MVTYLRPQRVVYSKDETASYNVSTNALLMSLLINIWEERDVANADLNRAYLHAEMDNFTFLKLEGEDNDIMYRVNNAYVNFVCLKIVKKVMYLMLLKAFYICVKSALLWYKLFTTTL